MLPNADIVSFADPLKHIIATSFGISLSILDMLKNSEHTTIAFNKNMREILQLFGTDAMKNWFGEDVWVEIMRKQIEKSTASFIIIPDFRFLSENIDGAITVKVTNNSVSSNDAHRSENELNDFLFDYEIDNTNYNDITKELRGLAKNVKSDLCC